jgi:transposase
MWPRPGRPRTVTDEQVEAIVITTLESKPTDATHWSTRSLAAHLGVSQDAVWRTWQAFGLQPPPPGEVQALDRPAVRGEGL